MTEQIGAIAGYTLEAQIGSGGMGAVYLARERESDRLVALKLLKNTAELDPLQLKKFRREAETIANLEHPHIVPVYAFGEWEGVPYLVMRYIPEGSVADRLAAEGQLPLEKVVKWVGQIADALDLAHQQGIVHKDVKPSNILLDQRENAYLADFGIAAAADESGTFGAGSVLYAAPEQGRGEIIDGRADLYALAVTLFEMLTGEVPYSAETPIGVMVRHMQDPIPSATARNPAIPAGLDSFIQRGMAKDPAQRPLTGRAFAAGLQAALLPSAEASPSPLDTQVFDAPLTPDATAVDLRLPQEELAVSSTLVDMDVNIPVAPTLVDQKPSGAMTLVAQPAAEAEPAPEAARRGSWTWLVGAGLGLVLVIGGLALWGRTAVAPPPPQATQAAIIVPTSTAPPEPTPLPEGVLLIDRFDEQAEAGDAEDEIALMDGTLQFQTEASQFRLFWATKQVEARDQQISVEVVDLAVESGYEIGVVCRWRSLSEFVALILQSDGIAVAARSGADGLSILGQGTWDPETMVKEQSLRLEATCLGENLTLAVDGEVVLEGIDPEPQVGDVALMGRPLADGAFRLRFDNLEIREE